MPRERGGYPRTTHHVLSAALAVNTCGVVFPRDLPDFMGDPFDLVVVGAGIVGLAHALAAARLGKRVVVIDREAQAVGASIRNFGFVTVTGQERGDAWRRARRSRDIWAAVAPRAGIAIEQTGLWVSLRHPESMAVAEAFLATEMGEGCRLLGRGGMDEI